MRKTLLFVLLLVGGLVACDKDSYDTGDGSLSYMRADFVEAETDASSRITSVVTDNNDRLSLTKSLTAKWAKDPNSVYRALLYYNRIALANGGFEAEPIAISQVLTPPVKPIESFEGGLKTHPVTFVSAWRSANGKYLNLDLKVKTGTVNGDSQGQIIGMAYKTPETGDNGNKKVRLRFYHDQNNVPEYYSTQLYVSVAVSAIPLELSQGDEISIVIQTYEGEITKTFTL
ncbi:MAG: NigD-like protein [Prevotella sp.]